jgi:hypothetical protein
LPEVFQSAARSSFLSHAKNKIGPPAGREKTFRAWQGGERNRSQVQVEKFSGSRYDVNKISSLVSNPIQLTASSFEYRFFVGSGVKYVVIILAALSVFAVLITPAPDELPCTTAHKSLQPQLFLANITSVLAQPVHLNDRPASAETRFVGVVDVLSLTCTFLC